MLYKSTERNGSDGYTWYESCPWYQLARQIFIGFSLSLQANVAVVLQTGRDHFLPHLFQFTMHHPVIVWWWIPILTQLNGYSLLILFTMYCIIGRLMSGKFWLQAVHHSSGDWSLCHLQMKNVYSAGWWKTRLGLLTLLCDKGRSKHGATEPAAGIWGCQLTAKSHVICRTRTCTEWSGRL